MVSISLFLLKVVFTRLGSLVKMLGNPITAIVPAVWKIWVLLKMENCGYWHEVDRFNSVMLLNRKIGRAHV